MLRLVEWWLGLGLTLTLTLTLMSEAQKLRGSSRHGVVWGVGRWTYKLLDVDAGGLRRAEWQWRATFGWANEWWGPEKQDPALRGYGSFLIEFMKRLEGPELRSQEKSTSTSKMWQFSHRNIIPQVKSDLKNPEWFICSNFMNRTKCWHLSKKMVLLCKQLLLTQKVLLTLYNNFNTYFV